MKKLYTVLSLLFILAVTGNANATTWNIGVMNFEFTNVPATVNVGDTITWNWVGGSHTTTSTSVPSGAASWDQDINSSSPSFSYVVAVPGAYAFVCAFHPSMTGAFVAQSVSGVAAPTAGSLNVFVTDAFDGLRIRYTLNENTDTRVSLTDLSGKIIFVKTQAAQPAGLHETVIASAALPKGIYLITIQANNAVATRKASVN